ncbi:ABC transporter ATP-binding protein [Albimonas pacifica]|uniref:Carbohydrate ABC transporter ATP-binding protein, CUT1 family n=1 Tax=Albimonas pacifica TaxID=1114924 RepID=A0A1I3J2G8_9RHOB|nr:ABC transporter ATP-binding protein [Albimonas pacifica]SFI54303.1 carbohydrate ABC transporter ATP-binding protein, CUT1 family [Albimonas pacifica]
MSVADYVSLSGVTRRWDGRGGVEDVSLRVPAGTFTSILGPSGCGKSTLLRLISGLERPQAGTVRIAGRDVTHEPASARGLAMVFQSYALFPHLSVRENILFGLRVRRSAAAEREARYAEAVAMLGLEGLGGRRPAALSGGQRQRVALARAVVSGHRLCLMDEPLSNLDAKLRQSVRRDIRALQRRLGLTVIYVTHDQTEAMSLSDQVVLMRAGRVEQAGSPVALYERPATAFAAEFVGDPPMAMIDGAALGEPGVTVGVRPEHLAAAPAGAGDLAGRIVGVEYLGSRTLLAIGHPAARGLVVSLPGRVAHAPGETLGLVAPPEHRLRFDARSGRALGGAGPDGGGRTGPGSAPDLARRPGPSP